MRYSKKISISMTKEYIKGWEGQKREIDKLIEGTNFRAILGIEITDTEKLAQLIKLIDSEILSQYCEGKISGANHIMRLFEDSDGRLKNDTP